jgi:hypothetical protein
MTLRARTSRRMGAIHAALVAGVLGLGLLAGAPVLASASASDATTAPGSYTPVTGALFNNPLGRPAAQRRLFTHITRTINSVPPGGRIRIAVFSFADKEMSQALIAAYRRGVKVRVAFAGNRIFPPMANLRRVMGSNLANESFVVFCDHSCRGTGGQMHAKFFQFSRAGDARRITMVGSNNITRFNAEEQWSDLYTVTQDLAYYRAFRGWFGQLKNDQPVEDPYLHRELDGHVVDITPVRLRTHADPIMSALDQVVCETRSGDLDPAAADPEALVPTEIMIAAHAWNGERGKVLARKVAALQRSGCAVSLFYGEGIGGAVKEILGNARVRMSSGTHRGILTHEKLMIIRGNFGGVPATTKVWTGSHNWSDGALGRDDLIVQIDDETVGQQYVDAFRTMWSVG